MGIYQKKYDVIVVGAGHAGIEAALASARMGCKVLVLTIDLDKIGAMPCSPSIGGSAKGQLVKEIDALGGEMARIADQTAIQYKTLNTKKGPAVHATRTQNDKIRYHILMKSVLEKTPGLDVKQAMVESLFIENNRVQGIIDRTGFGYLADAVVIAAGTFLNGLVHIGSSHIEAGRAGEFAALSLPRHMKALGFELGRMKTGTPPRLDKKTIDFSRFVEQKPDEPQGPFSMFTRAIPLPQVSSFMGHTNERSRKIVVDNIEKSPLYSGAIKGVSARYCPSFEDKAMRFPDRISHHVILEAEGLDTDEIYASGLGNSLPVEIQLEFFRSVEGLETVEVMRPAYAIEYDYVNPLQLKPTLETKLIAGLFLAGQINGTSGYEEAAAQGMWAGINAACQVQKRPPFILDRSQAYMAVLVDDLITRGTREPYRMFTSRAEYRLMLREDNADLRLSEIGHSLGLIGHDKIQEIRDKKSRITSEIARLRSAVLKPTSEVNAHLQTLGTPAIDTGIHLDHLLKRAEVAYTDIARLEERPAALSPQVAAQVEIEVKYEGYIKRQTDEIKKFRNLERMGIPDRFDYDKAHGLSNELKEKLKRIRPASLGQASRIDGMTPSAISALMIVLKKEGGLKAENKQS
jgi:tRNA uridine 5-carboxymethylaminomethyl modification enzyme